MAAGGATVAGLAAPWGSGGTTRPRSTRIMFCTDTFCRDGVFDGSLATTGRQIRPFADQRDAMLTVVGMAGCFPLRPSLGIDADARLNWNQKRVSSGTTRDACLLHDSAENRRFTTFDHVVTSVYDPESRQ